MSSRIDNRLSRLVESLRSRLFNPFIDPEDAMRIEYMLRDHEARMESIRASNFRNTIKGVAKGEPTRAIIKTTSIPTEYPRNVQAERMAHEIAVASHKLPQYNASLLPAVIRKPVNFFPFRKYDFVGKDRTLYDTNWAYNESGVPPEWSMNLPVTEEQAREFRRIDERRNKAESLRRQRRLKRGREEQAAREAFSYDMMDEFDQKMADLTKRYGGDAGKADIAMRNLLKKELPPFFKNSRMSTKDLHRTAEFFRSAGKVPFVGGMIKHPYATLATSAMWALGTYAGSTISSAKAAVKWQNIAGVWGRPSDEFIRAAEDAGLKAEEIDSKWAQLSQKFGSPLALRAIGGMKPGIAKGFTMASLGLDEDAVRIFDKLSGAESSEARKLTEHVNKIETVEKYGFTPGTKASTTMRAFGYRIPLWGILKKWIDAKSLAELEQIKDPEIRRQVEELSGFSIRDIDEPISDIRQTIYDVQSAAIADSQASEIISSGQGASTGSTNIKGDTHITIEVGTIETDSPQDFIKQMKALGSQYFQEVGEAFDQKAR